MLLFVLCIIVTMPVVSADALIDVMVFDRGRYLTTQLILNHTNMIPSP